jgi:aryl-alcohol dehydrogenase-like predicted oxidoreductase
MGFEPTILGRTGLKVGRIGISAAYGAPAKSIEEAFERGANYFYWGALRRGMMADGIRRLAKKNRDKMVIVVQNYWPWARLIPKSLKRALKELDTDYADVLLFSTLKRRPNQRAIDQALKLQDKGLVRHLGLACHHRPRLAQVEKEKIFDVFHVRYSAVHRGAEKDVFLLLPEKAGPGIVIFTATCHTKLLRRDYVPRSEKTPRAIDCYRFVLSHPSVHLCVTGAQNLQQVRHALMALELGPMAEEELGWMRRVGNYIYSKK